MVSDSIIAIGQLIIAIAIPIAGSSSGRILGGDEIDWYKNLSKPSWIPPSWVFSVVWIINYVLMGVASWIVYQEGGFNTQTFPLVTYVITLVFANGWTLLFFGLKRIDYAFVCVVFLLGAVANSIYFFYTANPIAAYLLIPLLLWVLVVSYLNWSFWQQNPVEPKPSSDFTEPLYAGAQSA